MTPFFKAPRGLFLMRLSLSFFFGFICFVNVVNGAVPTLTSILPFGVNPGEAIAVKFVGKFDGVDRRVWCDDPALVFTAPDTSGNAFLRVGIDARRGVHLLRFQNSEGVSAPLRMMVGGLPRLEEKEPNDEVSKPQLISKIPAWIQGQLEKAGDVDGYSFSLKKDVPIFIRVDAYEIGSAVDMHLHILDPSGVRIATATNGRNLDPALRFTPPADGVYVLQLAGFAHPPAADVNFAGAVKCPYLVTVTDEPLTTRVFPAAIPPSGKVEVELRGLVRKSTPVLANFDRQDVLGNGDVGVLFPTGARSSVNVVCSRYPVKQPVRLNEGEVPLVVPPVVFGGEVMRPAQTFECRLAMKKGEKLQARFWSRSLGLGMEGDLLVKGPNGETVATSPNPSDVFAEPVVSWSAGADGDYVVSVKDLFGRGGEGMEFVLELAPMEPSCVVEIVEGKPMQLTAGKSSSLKVKVLFSNGWKEPVVLRMSGLPNGVFAPEVTVPEKGGEVEVHLHAAINAPAGTGMAGLAGWTKSEPPRVLFGHYPSRGDLQRGHSDSDSSRDLWITVGATTKADGSEMPKK